VSKARSASWFMGIFTLIHGLTSIALYLWSIQRAMEISYRGMPRTWRDSVLEITSNLLLSPLFALFFHFRFDVLQGVGAYIAAFSNSFLWALAAWWLKKLRLAGSGEPGGSRA
jgi:hypothetical protein